MEERARRVGENEALFREVNERVREVAESFSVVSEYADFVCECGDGVCTKRIAMTLAEYELVRSDPRRFVIVDGHEAPAVERVVERGERFSVVEKDAGEPAALAVETDPRR